MQGFLCPKPAAMGVPPHGPGQEASCPLRCPTSLCVGGAARGQLSILSPKATLRGQLCAAGLDPSSSLPAARCVARQQQATGSAGRVNSRVSSTCTPVAPAAVTAHHNSPFPRSPAARAGPRSISGGVSRAICTLAAVISACTPPALHGLPLATHFHSNVLARFPSLDGFLLRGPLPSDAPVQNPGVILAPSLAFASTSNLPARPVSSPPNHPQAVLCALTSPDGSRALRTRARRSYQTHRSDPRFLPALPATLTITLQPAEAQGLPGPLLDPPLAPPFSSCCW